MNQVLYSKYRISSVTRPELTTGLPQGIFVNPLHRTYDEVKARDAKSFDFYREGPGMDKRGAELEHEMFVLEAYSVAREWVFIKRIEPLPGKDPRATDDSD